MYQSYSRAIVSLLHIFQYRKTFIGKWQLASHQASQESRNQHEPLHQKYIHKCLHVNRKIKESAHKNTSFGDWESVVPIHGWEQRACKISCHVLSHHGLTHCHSLSTCELHYSSIPFNTIPLLPRITNTCKGAHVPRVNPHGTHTCTARKSHHKDLLCVTLKAGDP